MQSLNFVNRYILSTVVLLGYCVSVQADELVLEDQPIFLGSTVQPNVFFMLDDSGSMDWEFMMKSYWHACSYDEDAPAANGDWDCGYIRTDGLYTTYGDWNYRAFIYIYETSDNAYGNGCSRSVEDCDDSGNPFDHDWRALTSSLNTVYYDPAASYTPYEGPCHDDGTYCQDASFTSARSNPREGEPGYTATIDLSSAAHVIGPASYHLWIDDKGFNAADGRPRRGANINPTNGANGWVDLWDTHYEIQLNSANVTVTKISYNPTAAGLNATSTLLATLNDTNACYNILGPIDITTIESGDASSTDVDGANCRTIAEAKTNFANWYQYNRRRHMSSKSAVTSVIKQFPAFRYGISLINNHGTLFVEVPEEGASIPSHNDDALDALYSYNWQAFGTPLRRGLEVAGKYYDNELTGKDDPIIHACQQNFTLLLTDGYWNGGNPASAIGDADDDDISITVADVAKYYYDKDLSSLADEVKTSEFDPATHQHMVTFTISFGVTGNLVDTDGDGNPDPALEEDDDWGDPFASNAEKIDDMWHAAYNSKGIYVAATSPASIAEGLTATLSNISDRVSSFASVAQNAAIITTDTKVYQALFDTNKWHGQLIAYPINADGSIGDAEWDAGCILTGGSTCTGGSDENTGKTYSERVIYTANDNNDGVLFQFPADYENVQDSEISSTQVNYLLDNSAVTVSYLAAGGSGDAFDAGSIDKQTYGEKLVNYLKGDDTNNQQNSGDFRVRTSILGDIISSTPVFVGAPNKLYPDTLAEDSYYDFKEEYDDRTDVLYVGSNDGMLHGFDASTGEELIAFVPNDKYIYQNLPTLSYTTANTSTGYVHKYFVDGAPTVADAVVNDLWKTVIVGGLNGGGQSLYALDVTDPDTFTNDADGASDVFLWQFDDSDDADLGFTYAQPIIARVNTNSGAKWAAIVGNGYNSTVDDGNASTSGKATLFIIYLDGGLDGVWTEDTDYVKIPVGDGTALDPSGLSSAFAADTDGDFDVDVVYAGDLDGNMWRFDLTDGNTDNWKTEFTLLFAASTDEVTKPITTQPIAASHPNGLSYGIMVYFGTGKFLEATDNSQNGQDTQTFYAVWDKGAGATVSGDTLVAQTIVSEVSQGFDTDDDGENDDTVEARIMSDNSVNWDEDYGWYLDFIYDGDNNGERLLSTPIIRSGRVIFTTLIPSDSPCDFGGDSWLMELNAADGAYLDESPFDLNDDGDYDEGDEIAYSVDGGDGGDDSDGGDGGDGGSGDDETSTVPAGGIKSEVGITPKPTVLITEDKSNEVKVLSGTGGLTSVSENPGDQDKGRQSWRILK